MKTLFLLNEAPYGGERTYNALRLAGALAKESRHEVRVFLMGDAVITAHQHQKVPEGFYNTEAMLGKVITQGGQVVACRSCLEARGMSDDELTKGSYSGSLAQLAEWTEWSDKTLVF
jgi:uncharacterized protein involved in oxidation of intracellular sulfur